MKQIIIHFSDCFYPRINGVTSAISSIVYSLKDDFINILIAPNYEQKNNDKIKIENYKDYLTVIRLPSYVFLFNKEDRFMSFSNNVVKQIFYFIYNNFTSRNWIIFNHNIFNSFFIALKFYKYFINYNDKMSKNNNIKKIFKIFYFHTFWEYYIHYVPLPSYISKFILKLLNRKVIENSDIILVANEYVKNYILQNYFKNFNNDIINRIKVLPLPLNVIFWEDKELEIDKILRNEKYIMYAGRLAKEKNLFFLIDIFKEISLMDNSFEFYICGDGPDKNKLVNYVIKNNLQHKVIFTGYLDQELIRRYYKFSQAVLFVSKTETLGLVLLEAMAQKTLVIALNVKPFNNIITNNYNGLLINTEDPKLFAIKIIEALNNKELINKVKENGFNFSLNYHPKTFNQNFIKIINYE